MTEILIHSFRKGDRIAFQKIFSILYPSVCYFARRYLAGSSEAEDVAQEVFINLWEQRKNFTGSITQVKAFLYISARNKCLNILKHRKVRGAHQSSLRNDIGENPTFEEILIRTEVMNNIKKAVEALPPGCKQIINLSMEGFKSDEIAAKLNISVNTVKLQKKIAYRKLRETIGQLAFHILFF